MNELSINFYRKPVFDVNLIFSFSSSCRWKKILVKSLTSFMRESETPWPFCTLNRLDTKSVEITEDRLTSVFGYHVEESNLPARLI